MPKTHSKEAAAREAATKLAEGIGEALGVIVNRLESLDAEREKVYKQLLAVQQRFSSQVARFGDAIGQSVTSGARHRPGGRPQPTQKAGRTAPQRAASTTRAATKTAGKKAPVTCGVCGTPGHNARGHAKWEASQR